MLYLTLFLLGISFDRYIVPIFDLFTELLNHKLSGIAQIESINSRKAELLFQREMGIDTVDSNEPRIGFQYPEKADVEDEEWDEEDRCGCKRK